MTFIWPPMLVLLLAIPVGAWVYVRREQGRRARVVALGSLQPPAGQATRRAGRRGALRRRIPGALLLTGMTMLVLAMARPQSVVGTPRFEGTVILSFDVSGSMAADDMAPTRMEASKAAARTFVARQPASILIGVVAFSDSGFSMLVPTADQTQVLAAIDRLGPERGTSVGRGIVSSLSAIAAAAQDPEAGYYTNRSPDPNPMPPLVPPGTYAPAAIVLLTDGENNQRPDPIEAARVAADSGVRIFTVGLGTTAGTTLEVEGFRVHSRLDEPVLRQIAEITDGAYFAAADPQQLAAIYDDIETRFVIRSEAMEVTSLFAGAGVLILVVGALGAMFWLGRVP